MNAFRDLFSSQAATYASARPTYPAGLYDAIVAACPGTRAAWDCATGNGQAARDLARHFARVIATDASAEQIAQAAPLPNVQYRVATAEESGLEPASVELVTVAQALHWLDHDRFYPEVRRVTVRGGLLAAWSYGTCSAGDDVEPLLREFEFGTVGPYWHAARRWVDDGYRTIPFPFTEVPMPRFRLRQRWTLQELGLYLSSWSAVVAYRRDRGLDPVGPLLDHIEPLWGAGRVRDVSWPLALRVGRIA